MVSVEYLAHATDKPTASIEQLNELGSKGWRLVTIVNYDSAWYYYFIREKKVN